MLKLERNNKSKLSICIVTGFLGSGKTSFLKYYTEQLLKRDEKITVIMNEFGDFDVDSKILGDKIQTISLQNGCVCCDLQQDLINQLSVLINQKQSQFVIIEATGIAHPLQLIEACFDPSLAQYVHPPLVVGLVDAPRFLNRERYTASTQALMEEQIAVSQALIVNKTDLVGQEEQHKIETALKQINPNDTIYFTSYGRVNIDELEALDTARQDVRHRHLHHHGISSIAYTFTAPIDRQIFYQFILRLPDNIYRLKGYVRFRDDPETTYLFQFANGLPDYEPIQGEVQNTIVLIGENLDKERLRNQLDALQFT